MELTKVEALEMAMALWEWLRDTGENDKAGWPGWQRRALLHNCPLCEYTVGRCILCPVPAWAAAAAVGRSNWRWKTPCERDGTPYRDWRDAGQDDNRAALVRAAAAMVVLLQAALDTSDQEQIAC